MAHESVIYLGDIFNTPDSSNVVRFKYDYDSQVLIVSFQGGRSYAYDDVPPAVVEAWCDASSKGKYHARYIKWAYTYHEL